MANIGFIGLGNMGAPMVANLVKSGHQVQAFDLNSAAIDQAVEVGAIAAGSAVEAVKGAEFVITMLPAGKHVESLYITGETPLFDAVEPGALLIDSSTIDSETAKRVAAECSQRGVDFIDAPVSGGVGAATAGTLAFMVGASEVLFAKAEPILQGMGKNIFRAGESGAGQIAKCCNNMMLAILMTGTAEALNMGIKNGLDPAVLSEIMKQSSGNNIIKRNASQFKHWLISNHEHLR